jgi:hypothetical protein
MEMANRWADGEYAIQTKRHRSPEEDRNRNNNQNRRHFYRQFLDYDGPSQVAASFRGNSRGNHRDDYQRRNEQRNDHRYAPSSSRQNNRPRFQRPYNISPEDLLNRPCQMHFYLDSEGKRQSGHLQKDFRTFQALHRYAEQTNS